MSVCTKVGYVTKHEAKAAKRECQRFREMGTSWRRESRIYRCDRPGCNQYHLTSQPHPEYDTEPSLP